MRLTYDPAKNERNIAERGIAFSMAEDLDWTTALIAEGTRRAYPERRFQALGLIGGAPAHAGLHPTQRRGARDQPAPCEQTRKEPICHRASPILRCWMTTRQKPPTSGSSGLCRPRRCCQIGRASCRERV